MGHVARYHPVTVTNNHCRCKNGAAYVAIVVQRKNTFSAEHIQVDLCFIFLSNAAQSAFFNVSST
jgi:hypothetical protein